MGELHKGVVDSLLERQPSQSGRLKGAQLVRVVESDTDGSGASPGRRSALCLAGRSHQVRCWMRRRSGRERNVEVDWTTSCRYSGYTAACAEAVRITR